MKAQGGYVPPQYIPLPLQQEDNEFESNVVDVRQPSQHPASQPDPVQWSSGICACCDDMPSCCIGSFCPCFLFAKNAEFLGSGTLAGSCMTHFVLWGLVNSLCCLCTGGILFGLTGSVVACYAGGYRRALRAKYNLQEAPCGDCATHVCCHLCAICQEYREIRERSQGSSPVLGIPVVIAPPIQTMGMDPPK
ncbi:PLAC8 motif-containing protein [Dioscorea alata]|uniref:PLAC8 motif-containing protein n=2 Tax=Dioscorea alata TaxID=55571 RepID=A0ACB7V2F4_DIOAL|nr:PLAC8 motif-containing protein [Dioscorea alata]